MNYKMVLKSVAKVLILEGVLLLLPFVVSIIYGESAKWAFLITAGICVAAGLPFVLLIKPSSTLVYSREGFVTVALGWIAASLFGALPFVISKDIPSYIDALFETVSGFTTTGASILNDVEALSKGALFWRSFSHWIGGMGLIVFIVAISKGGGRSIHVLRAEMPGPTVDKIAPRSKDTAIILYLIYVAMTAFEVIMLLLGKMPFFEALLHSFGTAGTGGFGIRNDSLAGYIPYIQWVVAVFMVLFSVNFNCYYLILVGKVKNVLKDTEFLTFIGIVLAAVAAITVNVYSVYESVAASLRVAAFEVASTISTTGYSVADYNAFPTFSKSVLLVLMFIGGSAGSTAGGLKVSRVVILFKRFRRDIKQALRPKSVEVVKMDKALDETTVNGVTSYFGLYMVITLLVFVFISIFDNFGVETNFSATVSLFNNVGPGLGAVGPAGNYGGYSVVSKLMLTFTMLLGRLEIYPVIIALSPSTWLKK